MKIFKLFKKDTWIRPFLGKYRKSLFFALTLGFMTFFCGGALMFNSGFLISKSAAHPENILLVYVPIVLTRAFGIGRPVFRYLERLTSHNWVLKLTSELRLKLYRVLEKDAVFFKNKYQTGDILGLLSEDIDHIQNLYLRTVFPTVIAWILTVFIVIALGIFSLWFALVMLLLLCVQVILFPLMAILVNGARQEKQKMLKNELYTELTDNILGVSDWIFSQRGKEYLEFHKEIEDKLHHVTRAIKKSNHYRNTGVQLMFGVIAIALLLWSGMQFPGNHGGAANWIAAFVLVIFPLIDAFAPLNDAAQETNIYQDSLKRLNGLSNESSDERKPSESIKQLNAPFVLTVNNLSYHYPDDNKQVLNDLTLSVGSGQKLAILGRSGSGKTTLAKLLRGDLEPSVGSLKLNGIDVSDLGESVSDYIGVIHQAPYLFNTTISNNLRIGNEDATTASLWQVLERVGLKNLVTSLPEGLETVVDEAGLRFSGGERHRLALARILLKNTPIVILDEPTVSLDPLTEQDLIETFMKQLEGKTIIWITHHLQGLSMMDKVIFIEDGKLKIEGSPDELASSNEHYKKLLAIDHGDYVVE
ncbi:thiol reductant ABC exporter subunit CydC [Liquorilactobacillus mali]|uniref:Transport ATP-binding protein CydD n=1 Tax=Liquorilactobacillus mali KCTC 3596 = DSM 20444 TaxID=1046596 RepID=J1F0W3_9LACO|nr:thiol reductant ABC exporter subunit CydC [Liquorilactobacillus mali]EJE97899.1 ABC superfamily ATP binding cassette transporter, ABC/membrane protein [Liquorilactobacillus mali KCTC 3596 = DSM 20444]KRN09476.1 transport ATP-binding protein CydD [Liquorilactobacillus mali KCTC 3596 = DSM 20444]QFQ75675.1 thiol reductant ABC exporter subunit CydC [Liquorilactobacillus mali]